VPLLLVSGKKNVSKAVFKWQLSQVAAPNGMCVGPGCVRTLGGMFANVLPVAWQLAHTLPTSACPGLLITNTEKSFGFVWQTVQLADAPASSGM
jgi:hypothetical protein